MKRLFKPQYLFVLFILFSSTACITSFDIGPDQPCGDGRLDKGEECDDGNANNDDSCSNSCTINPGWKCLGNSCITICGDGIKAGDELCDDKNTTSGDGCNENCRTESKYKCEPTDPSDPTSTSKCISTETSSALSSHNPVQAKQPTVVPVHQPNSN